MVPLIGCFLPGRCPRAVAEKSSCPVSAGLPLADLEASDLTFKSAIHFGLTCMKGVKGAWAGARLHPGAWSLPPKMRRSLASSPWLSARAHNVVRDRGHPDVSAFHTAVSPVLFPSGQVPCGLHRP